MTLITDKMNKAEDKGFAYNQNAKIYDAKKVLAEGHVFFTLREKDGSEIKWDMPNVVVQGASVLAARLFKDNTEPLHGLFCLALGTGNPSWDLQNPPAPSQTQTLLENEIIRKQFASTNFIDPLGAVSATPTNVVDFTAFFTEAEAVAPIVEMGLFGGSSTLATNSGSLVTYRTMRVINKSATSTLTISWRLTF